MSEIKMVDISAKKISTRIATATATVHLNKKAFNLLKKNLLKKGDALTAAKIAGIIAAKRTSQFIPLCHPIQITNISFNIKLENSSVKIECTVKSESKTGTEMEALVGVSISALTVYDMCKSYQKDIEISDIYLLKKSGGKSGNYKRNNKSGLSL